MVGTGWIAGRGFRNPQENDTYNYVPNNNLTEIHSPIVTNEECNQWLKKFGRPNYQVSKLITCTRQERNSGWCWNDQGAPLFLIKNESYMVQVGIASVRPAYSAPCGVDGYMTLYTRVSEYLGWIHRRISSCGNHPFYNYTGVVDP